MVDATEEWMEEDVGNSKEAVNDDTITKRQQEIDKWRVKAERISDGHISLYARNRTGSGFTFADWESG